MKGNNPHNGSRNFCVKILIAGVKVEAIFNCIEDLVLCKGYLGNFNQPDFVVSVTQEELKAVNRPFQSSFLNGEFGNIIGTESCIIHKKIVQNLIWYDTFLMHGSVISLDNHAYMFSAPSGTGKTTRTRLWLDEYPSSIVVNGDKPLIKVTNTDILACGTPWCGKEGWNTNTMVPLRAIFLLERANEDSIEEISLGKAFPVLLQQTHHPTDPVAMQKTIGLLKALESKVKIFRFRSTPTPESVRLAYETARPK